jgi:hypothetical protein
MQGLPISLRFEQLVLRCAISLYVAHRDQTSTGIETGEVLADISLTEIVLRSVCQLLVV